MGVYDRDILDCLDRHNGICTYKDLLDCIKNTPDFDEDRMINDIKNLEKDGLVNYNKYTEILTLRPKAQKPVVPMPPNQKK